MKSVSKLKYTLRFFIFKFDLNLIYRPYVFTNKGHGLQGLQKKLFTEEIVFFL